ncbi:hypothetical protein DPMN_156014 [Dreissena polymorpha]|uniref:Uncharacterized protein n=1 Tax=Dreissena polymorpha TaxID=45954 RepID=A0A9D4JAF8_DREPO|nr:hypothetical protein DPMN_156014 [Dreissena polymorpha]
MPPGSHVFRNLNADPKGAQNIIGTNLLPINVASRVLTRKNAPHPGNHVFQRTGIIIELVLDIIGMNLLTKFHEDRTVNVASSVLTRARKAQNIIGTNLLTKFHEDRKINVASRVLTRKNAPPPGNHMNLLTKFHEDRTINVASRVLTRFYYSHIRKNAPPLGSHFYKANIIIFELIQDIIKTNPLTKFHEDWTINVASRVKNAPPLVAMFLKQPKPFSHSSIIETNLLTKVLTRKIAPPRGGHVFQPTGIIFELV